MRREDVAGSSGMKRSAGLGRGLSALLGEMEAIETAQSTGQGVEAIAISAIIPNQRQPRRKFDATKLDELAESIKAQGLLQPILVRSEEHTSELQSLMRNSYAVFCLKKKKNKIRNSAKQHTTSRKRQQICR